MQNRSPKKDPSPRSLAARLDRAAGDMNAFLLVLAITLAGCFSEQTPSAYYGKVLVPKVQEFRWSDGGLPQTFDPAFAAAAPDTDVVRALFEGLTEYDPKTLQPVPAVAKRWESSPDGRVWTFYLREDAKWSNGEPVTAGDGFTIPGGCGPCVGDPDAVGPEVLVR